MGQQTSVRWIRLQQPHRQNSKLDCQVVWWQLPCDKVKLRFWSRVFSLQDQKSSSASLQMTSGFIISNEGLIVPVTVKKLMCLEYLYHELFIQTENSHSENKKILRALSFQDSPGGKKKKKCKKSHHQEYLASPWIWISWKTTVFRYKLLYKAWILLIIYSHSRSGGEFILILMLEPNFLLL